MCPRLEERMGEEGKKAGWREELADCEARLENPRHPLLPPLLHLQLQRNLKNKRAKMSGTKIICCQGHTGHPGKNSPEQIAPRMSCQNDC